MADGLALTYNGEIYNYREVRRDLEARGITFRSQGDTEVLLRAYQLWGVACLDRLRGFFSFALWDGGRRRLFAARDRLGQKPFYYRRLARGLVFASELGALWAATGERARLEPGVAARYLAFGHQPNEGDTFFEGTAQLAPGTFLLWAPGGESFRVERYWSPRVHPASAPGRREAAATLDELLRTSITLRLRSDVPVAISLSGGVDSGTILAYAAQAQAEGRLEALTAVQDQVDLDEAAAADQTLAAFPEIPGSRVDARSQAGAADFAAFLDTHDEPMNMDGSIMQFRFMRAIAGRGVKVILSGQGADELFLGYPWYLGPLAVSQMRALRPGTSLRLLVEFARRRGLSPVEALRYLASSWPIEGLVRHKERRTTAWMKPSIWREHCEAAWREAVRCASRWPDMHLWQVRRGSLVGLLRDEDRNAMRHGVETRLPYLDHPLVEWGLRLPPGLLYRRGHTKWILRRVASERLPAAICWSKTKRGFYVSMRHHWAGYGPCFRELLAGDDLAGFVRRDRVLALRSAGQLESLLEWRLFNLAWCARRASGGDRPRAAALTAGAGDQTRGVTG